MPAWWISSEPFCQFVPESFGSTWGGSCASIQTFQPVSEGFLALGVPPREMLLAPILPRGSLLMLSPQRYREILARLSIGLALRVVGLFSLNAPRPRRVLFVDGEMVLSDLQVRLNSILAGLGTEITNDGFRVLAADHSELGINLGSAEGKQELERHLDGVDLLILDNLSTLMANGSEGASDAWLPMQNWLLRLRRKGIAVLLTEHVMPE
jgi:putative DNA primase/helicase